MVRCAFANAVLQALVFFACFFSHNFYFSSKFELIEELATTLTKPSTSNKCKYSQLLFRLLNQKHEF